MFRRGGSAGGGITSGLERPQYNQGSVGAVGSEVKRIGDLYNKFAPNVQTQSMPGSVSSFLTNFLTCGFLILFTSILMIDLLTYLLSIEVTS